MEITVTGFVTGPLETNSYVVENGSGSCLIVDPSSGCDAIIGHLRRSEISPVACVLTHGHFDHIMGLPEILHAWPDTGVYIHEHDLQALRDPGRNGAVLMGGQFTFNGPVTQYKEGDLSIGGFRAEVLYIGGHSPGQCALVLDGHCLCGDALFAGSIGRTDLPGGDLQTLIRNVRDKILTLPETTIVYPGHGGRTSVGREKRANPFFIH